MLGSKTHQDAIMAISPNEKFADELHKMVKYWELEFDLDKWSITGVLLDVAVDVLFETNRIDFETEIEDDEDNEE
jgi:hypothetical protein